MKLRWDHPLWRRFAPGLARRLVKAYLLTCPCELVATPEVAKLIASGPPVIYTTWHCHLLSPLFTARRYRGTQPPMVLMASPSRDADWCRRGYSCGLIADGSRGPARVAQKGPLYLARETQAAILPVAVAARRKVTFNSWDRFELPLPLSPIALLVGEPLRVWPEDRGPVLEHRRLELEARLNRLFRQSQAYHPAGGKFF
jgi:lysophospholipid acyltransferase (LPLAT)-like uncharacterized protein